MSVTKEQTAVEFMLEGIINLTGVKIARDEVVVEQANRMFIKQMQDAYQSGFTNGMNLNTTTFYEWYEQFKKNKPILVNNK
jgi:hypothetical protein